MPKKLILLIGLVSLILVLYFLTPVRDFLSSDRLSDLKLWILSLGVFAPMIFALLYATATIFCLPGSVLTLLAGTVFGTWTGTIYVILASNLGANGAFLISRYLGKDLASKFLRGRLSALEVGIEKNAFNVVFGLRLLPVVPFTFLNYACGLSPIPWRDYFLGSLIGMIPGTFVYVSFGEAISRVSFKDPKIWLDPKVWGPFAMVLLFMVVMNILKKKKTRQPLAASGKNQGIST